MSGFSVSEKWLWYTLGCQVRWSYREVLRCVYRNIPDRYRTREHRIERHRMLRRVLDYHQRRRDHFVKIFGRNARSYLR